MIYVISKYENIDDDNSIIIDTTSHSKNWSRGLSPFFVKGGYFYDNNYSHNIENLWQFSKVYPEFVDENDNPTDLYFKWAKDGWRRKNAIRYPMGKGIKPLYSWWDGEKLTYIEARKKIYLPHYGKNVIKTYAFRELFELAKNNKNKNIYLRDFDGYNHIKENMSFQDVLHNNKKSMGHAFVIWYLLNKFIK